MTYDALKEDIVRTLSVPWARPEAIRPLLAELEKAQGPTDSGLRWAIANGLSVVADDSVADDLLRLAQDSSLGSARQMVVVALANLTTPRAVEVLLQLIDDEEVVGHAALALGKRADGEAEPKLTALLGHPKSWIRKEAKKALARVQRRSHRRDKR